MNWILTLQLIGAFALTIAGVGAIAILGALLWEWSTDPRDVGAYWDPNRFDA